MHVGAGRTRISTGAGPVSISTSLGGARTRVSARTAAARAASTAPSTAAERKAVQAQEFLAAAEALATIHRADFTPASRPIASPPPEPAPAEVAAVRQRHEKDAMSGISVFRRSDRATARARAAVAAERELEEQRLVVHQEHAEVQARLDELWAALCAGEPDVVMATLVEAFADNDAAAAPLAVDAAEVSIALLAPPESIVPEKLPALTDAGNLSLRKTPARQRATMYTTAVMAHVLVTLRETFAIVPSLTSARIVVMRDAGLDAYGTARLECVMAGHWTRAALERVAWDSVDAQVIATETATELIINLRAGTQLQPLNLAGKPAITVLLESVDLDELTT